MQVAPPTLSMSCKIAMLLLVQAAEFVHEKLWDPESKQLRRSFRVGPSAAQGFADDYAYMIAGLLDLYQAQPHISPCTGAACTCLQSSVPSPWRCFCSLPCRASFREVARAVQV